MRCLGMNLANMAKKLRKMLKSNKKHKENKITTEQYEVVHN